MRNDDEITSLYTLLYGLGFHEMLVDCFFYTCNTLKNGDSLLAKKVSWAFEGKGRT